MLIKLGLKVAVLAMAAWVGSQALYRGDRVAIDRSCKGCGPGKMGGRADYDVESGINWTQRVRYKGQVRATRNQFSSSPQPKRATTRKQAPTLAPSEAPSDSKEPSSFDNCYIITLERDTRRVAHVRNQVDNDFPGASIYWAIDGKNVTDNQIAAWQDEGFLGKRLTGFMDPAKPVGKPKISCLMSHVRLWQQLLQEPRDDAFYFILEDDTSPSLDFHTRYFEVLQELSDLSWDWVYLAIHPTWRHGNTLKIPGKTVINKAPRMVGNAGYLLSKRGAAKLMKKMFPCSLPKDQAIRILIQNNELEAYIVKTDLILVLGQQGQGFNKKLNRTFPSNIWPK
eukprot:m.8495 g.8495  ORF g.8495 m.8495 type:complete len:339 (-) comp4066_c0_seq1:1771-2787(-)